MSINSNNVILNEILETINNLPSSDGAGGTEEIENLIDQSGVLENTEGKTVEEKVEILIDKTDLLKKAKGINFKNDTKITSLSVDCSSYEYIDDFAYGCSNLKTVYLSNTENVKDWGNAFRGCDKLETVELIDFSSTTQTSNMFYGNNSIIHLRLAKNSLKAKFVIPSSKLTPESVQSIVDGLAKIEATQILQLHADIKAKLTEEQLATITSKNWSVA